MRRAVAFLAVGVVLTGCSSTVAGQASTDGAASPLTAGGTAGGPTTSTAPPAPSGALSTPPPSTDPATSSAAVDSSEQAAAASALPAGFYAAGDALGYRPMSTDEFDCTPDQASGCFGIMVFSVPGCPAGAVVTVGIFDKSQDPDTAIGTATGTTPPIDPGGSQAVVIGDSTGVAASLTARVQQVVC